MEPTTSPASPSTEPTTTPSTEPGATLLDSTDAPQGAPEKYEPFTLPEGFEMPEELRTEAETLLKDLNLPQDKAQRAVDFFTAKMKATNEANALAFAETTADWRKSAVEDKTLGTGTDIKPEVKQAFGKAIGLLPADLQTSFKEAMNMTGVGNHPAFIRAFYELGKRVTEGRPAQASAPAAVTPPGKGPTSLAAAIYPNLPE